MPDETVRFQTSGLTWGQRATLGELPAVLSPTGSPRRNLFLHGVNSFAARIVPRPKVNRSVVVDFGCGTGRFLRYWARSSSVFVVGTEITPEMLLAARGLGCPQNASLALTDGVTIPLKDESVDLIWCCGVLRYSLFVDNPAFGEIAKEMFRVLKPGGGVANCEMYVDALPHIFCEGFEYAGFKTTSIRVLTRNSSRIEQSLQSRLIPLRLISVLAQAVALVRFLFDSPMREKSGLRDYLFLWAKQSGGVHAFNDLHGASPQNERGDRRP